MRCRVPSWIQDCSSFMPLLLGLLLLSLSGCAKNLMVYRSHTLMFNEEGEPVHPNRYSQLTNPQPDVPRSEQGIPTRVHSFSSYPTETREEFKAHLQEIFDGLRESKKKKVLIFIHGGLNSNIATLERQHDLLTCEGDDCISREYYPIFINWRSSLWSSYRDRLFLVRQGERKQTLARATSPFAFSRDVLGALANLPLAVAEQVSDSRAPKSDPDWIDANETYKSLGIDIDLGRDCRDGSRKIHDTAKSVPFSPVKLVTLPAIDGFGQQAWRLLLRRTRVLFEPETAQARYPGDDAAEGDGALTELFRGLREAKRADDALELTIVGHSMGALVLNKSLRHFGDLDFDNVVYMAAACSIEDYQNTMLGGAGSRGYLRRHPDTHLYHLTLHERAEVQESRWGWVEVVPRGSLLAWIDNFLDDPSYRLDRTVGRIYNLLREIDRTPEDLRKRIHVKAFDFGNPSEQQPERHGDFTKLSFWQKSFWTSPNPRLDNCP